MMMMMMMMIIRIVIHLSEGRDHGEPCEHGNKPSGSVKWGEFLG